MEKDAEGASYNEALTTAESEIGKYQSNRRNLICKMVF